MHYVKLFCSTYQKGPERCCSETVQQAVPDEWNFNHFDTLSFYGIGPFVLGTEGNYPMAVLFLVNHPI